MSTKDEPMPPEARKAIRLAIATHLVANIPVVWGKTLAEQESTVNGAYCLADLLIAKSGL